MFPKFLYLSSYLRKSLEGTSYLFLTYGFKGFWSPLADSITEARICGAINCSPVYRRVGGRGEGRERGGVEYVTFSVFIQFRG